MGGGEVFEVGAVSHGDVVDVSDEVEGVGVVGGEGGGGDLCGDSFPAPFGFGFLKVFCF